jgi:hypothetical protein
MRLLKWRLNPTKSESPFPLPSAGSLAGGIFFGFFYRNGVDKNGRRPRARRFVNRKSGKLDKIEICSILLVPNGNTFLIQQWRTPMNNIEVNAVDIKSQQLKKSRSVGTGRKNLEAYRKARAEVLREFYANLDWESTLTYEDPEDQRKNVYTLEPTKDISPFDDLDKLEENMPNKENYSKFLG